MTSPIIRTAEKVEERRQALRSLTLDSTKEEVEWTQKMYDEALHHMHCMLDFYKNNRIYTRP